MVAGHLGENVLTRRSGAARERRGIGKATVSPLRPAAGAIEEDVVQNEACSLCLLINRRTKTMRVIDFRAARAREAVFVLQLARRQGSRRIYTLVERDEVSTWMKLGFNRGRASRFYKRSDAVPPRLSVDEDALRASSARSTRTTRRRARGQAVSGARSRGEDPDAGEGSMVKACSIARSRRRRSRRSRTPRRTRSSRRRSRAAMPLTAFEPFGPRRRPVATSSSPRATASSSLMSTESQSCFGNAFLELLRRRRPSTSAGHDLRVRTMWRQLLAEGTVSCFCVAPSDNLALASAFVFTASAGRASSSATWS